MLLRPRICWRVAFGILWCWLTAPLCLVSCIVGWALRSLAWCWWSRLGYLQQGRQHHEKPQSKHADQAKNVQWLYAPCYDIWKWNLGFNHRPNGRTCSGTKKNGENYAGHHPSRPEHNTWIRQQTGVTDIIDHIRQSKHRWAGHVARLQDNRWTIRATSWVPRRWLRPRGRPKTGWRDDLSRHLGTIWTRLAQDIHQWKLSREGFLHKGEKR